MTRKKRLGSTQVGATIAVLSVSVLVNCGEIRVPSVVASAGSAGKSETGGSGGSDHQGEAGLAGQLIGESGFGGDAGDFGGTAGMAGASGSSTAGSAGEPSVGTDPYTPCGDDIQGMVAHLDFDDCRPGYPLLKDRVGSVDATMKGDTRCAVGRFGRGVYFGGPHTTSSSEYGYVEEGDRPALSFTKQMSISLWVSVWDVPERSWAILLGKWFTMDAYQLTIEDSLFRFKIAMPKPPWGEVFVAEVPATKYLWVHLAGVVDGKTIRLYANGVAGAAREIDPNRFIQKSDRPLQLGGIVYNGSTNEGLFAGILDDVRLYDRALHEGEVRRLACLARSP